MNNDGISPKGQNQLVSENKMLTMKNISLIIVFCLLLLLPSICVAQEGYYRVDKEQLDFRLAVEDIAEAKGKDDWDELSDLKNKRFFVFKKVGVASADIDGVAENH